MLSSPYKLTGKIHTLPVVIVIETVTFDVWFWEILWLKWVELMSSAG